MVYLTSMNTDISLLLSASKIISNNLNSEAAVTALLQLLDEVNGLSKTRVLLLNQNNLLEIKYSYGHTESEIARGKYSLGEGITGKVVESGKIALVPDIRQEPSYLNKINQVSDFPRHKVAYIAVPILKDNKPIGVLAVYRSRPDDNTLHEDLNVLQIIASMIQMVLQISELLAEKTNTLTTENKELRRALLDKSLNHDIIGNSQPLKKAIKSALQAAMSNATVMLYGESGTGKEKFARMIHFSSSQKDQPFITVNCAAIPENLLESELFGHVKGSFTGATSHKMGKFEAANNGTLFLDEIGDMTYELQAKLLRALQEKTIQKVGSNSEMPVNVRVITATHKNIKDSVNQGKFRLDLYYRLAVLPIELPPLRDRSGDIKLLSLFFLNRANQRYRKNIMFSKDVFVYFSQYAWPGNIRELENIIERIAISSELNFVEKEQIESILENDIFVTPQGLDAQKMSQNNFVGRPYTKVSVDERDRIISSLQISRGNKTQAALNLGMTPRQLQYRIVKLEIEV